MAIQKESQNLNPTMEVNNERDSKTQNKEIKSNASNNENTSGTLGKANAGGNNTQKKQEGFWSGLMSKGKNMIMDHSIIGSFADFCKNPIRVFISPVETLKKYMPGSGSISEQNREWEEKHANDWKGRYEKGGLTGVLTGGVSDAVKGSAEKLMGSMSGRAVAGIGGGLLTNMMGGGGIVSVVVGILAMILSPMLGKLIDGVSDTVRGKTGEQAKGLDAGLKDTQKQKTLSRENKMERAESRDLNADLSRRDVSKGKSLSESQMKDMLKHGGFKELKQAVSDGKLSKGKFEEFVMKNSLQDALKKEDTLCLRGETSKGVEQSINTAKGKFDLSPAVKQTNSIKTGFSL